MRNVLTRRLVIPVAAMVLLTGCAAATPVAPTSAPPAPTAAPTSAPTATAAPQAEPTLVPTLAPPTVSAPGAGADELAQVKSAGTLRVGVSADNPPFAFYNSRFRVDGFDPALATDLAKRLGVGVDVNYFAFEGLLAALRLGQVDMAIASISDTPERR